MPPGHSKSINVSQIFPCWCLGRNPLWRIAVASYGADIALLQSRHARNLMAGERFQEVFPEVRHAPEREGQDAVEVVKQAAHEWGTRQGGRYYATGIGGGLTGRRYECLEGNTLIQTESGLKRIKDLQFKSASSKVLAYDTQTKRIEYRRIKAVSRSPAAGLYRVTTTAGRVVEATGDHPFFTGHRYIAADKLTPGDHLLCTMRKGVSKLRSSSQVEATQVPEVVLFPQLRDDLSQHPTWIRSSPNLSDMRRADAQLEPQILLHCLQSPCQQQEESFQVAKTNLSTVQCRVSSDISLDSILRKVLCRRGSRAANEWKGESRMAQRDESFTKRRSLCSNVPSNQTQHLTARRPRMFSLRLAPIPASASPQSESNRQSPCQSHHPLQVVSHEVPCSGAFQTEVDTVAMVERVRSACDVEVFNLQVEGVENFFANGVLTHNCGIIDDPIKDREAANSPTIREATLNWYRSVFYTRQMPDSRIVIIATRWHRDDLAGTLLREMSGGGEKWEVLNMPAIQSDGTALWPEMWPMEKLLEQKKGMGSVEFEALYQQSPQDKEGAMFKREWFTDKLLAHAPSNVLEWIRYWDLAATRDMGNNDPDWTAGALVGYDRDGRWYVKDIQHFRESPLGVETRIQQTAQIDGRSVCVAMEQEPSASGVTMIDHYSRRVLCGCNFRAVKPDSNKAIRAQPFSAACEAGNVFLVQGEWINAFLNEAEVFPFGSHDDMVDAASGAFTALSVATGAFSSESIASARLGRPELRIEGARLDVGQL